MAEQRKAQRVQRELGIHHSRNANCNPNLAFPLGVHSALHLPSAEQWLHLLGSRHTILLGDSVLRDLFIQLIRSLVGTVCLKADDAEGRANIRFEHFTHANFSFRNYSGSLSFLWAWPSLRPTVVTALAQADLVVFNSGAHLKTASEMRVAVQDIGLRLYTTE